MCVRYLRLDLYRKEFLLTPEEEVYRQNLRESCSKVVWN